MSEFRRRLPWPGWRTFWKSPAFLVGVGALLLVICVMALVDWLGADNRRIYTDGISIHQSASSGAVTRDVIWEVPEPPEHRPPGMEQAIEPDFSREGDMVIFAKGRPDAPSDLFVSRREHGGEAWSEPEPLAGINSEYDELGPALSDDRQLLYFYSNRPGGLGGYDIWVARWDGETWSGVENAGPSVNSPYDEYDPALSPDGGKLYFSSNRKEAAAAEEAGHQVRWPTTLRRSGEGFAFDIYAAAKLAPEEDQDGVPDFTQATRVDVLSSESNDGQIAFSHRGDFVYFSSNRPGGFGGYDIYRSRIMGGEIQPPENVGAPVNSEGDEMDPVLQMEGHRLLFTSSRDAETPGDFTLFQTTSREVVSHVPAGFLSRMWQMLRDYGWLLLVLLATLLAMWWLLWMLRQQDPERRMGLVQRCLAASVLLHLLLLFLFTTWHLHSVFYEEDEPAMEVAIDSGSLARERLSLDIREQLAELPAAQPPAPELPRLDRVPLPEIQPREPVADMRPPEAQFEVMPSEMAIAPEPSAPPPDQVPEPVAADLPTLELAMASPQLETPEPLAEPPAPDPPAPMPPTDLASAERQQQAIDRPVPQEQPQRTPTAEPELPTATAAAVDMPVVEAAAPRDVPQAQEPAPAMESLELAALPSELETPEAQPAEEAEPSAAVPPAALAAVERQQPQVEPGQQPQAAPVVPTAEAELPTATATGIEQPVAEAAIPRDLPQAQEPAPAMESLELAALPSELETPQAQPAEAAEPASAVPPAALAAVERQQPQVEPGQRPEATPETPTTEPELPETSPLAIAGSPQTDAGPEQDLPPVDTASISSQATSPLDLAVDLATAADMPSHPDVEAQEPSTDAAAFRPELEITTERSAAQPIEYVATSGPERRAELTVPDELALDELTPGLLAPSETQREVEREPDGHEVAPALPELALAMDFEMDSPGVIEQSYALRDRELRQPIIEELGGTQETEAAIEMALDWFTRNVGATGLALLTYYGWGASHKKEGPFQEPMAKALDWLLGQIGEDGDLRGNGGDMYDHGIATIALAEAYALTKDERIKPALVSAVDFIIKAQHPQGGWRYNPGQAGDTSVVGWQVMALVSAKLGGLEVPEDAFKRADQFMRQVGGGDEGGLYGYMSASQIRTPMVAEGMFAAQLLGGQRSEARMRESAEHLRQHLPETGGGTDYYYWYYGSLALYQHHGPIWEEWNEQLREILVQSQSGEGENLGSWDPEGKWADRAGRVVITAMATLSLQVYYRYLPLLQSGEF